LYRQGGWLALPSLFSTSAVAELEAEARAVRHTGQRNEWPHPDHSESRGSNPPRAFLTAHGAQTHWRLHAAPELIDTVAVLCGVRPQPIGGGTFTYYEFAGDFLGLHMDVASCDLTVITCLRETFGAARGGLLVYPNFMEAPLSQARAAGRGTAIPVAIEAGASIVLLGGVLPHEVTPMQPGQERVIAVMCYRIGGANP
jgi:hypothetical protein